MFEYLIDSVSSTFVFYVNRYIAEIYIPVLTMYL